MHERERERERELIPRVLKHWKKKIMKRERDDTKGFEVLEGKNNEKRLKSSIMSKGKTLLI